MVVRPHVCYIDVSTIPREGQEQSGNQIFYSFRLDWHRFTLDLGRERRSLDHSGAEFLDLAGPVTARVVSRSCAATECGYPGVGSFEWILQRCFSSADCLRRCSLVSATSTPQGIMRKVLSGLWEVSADEGLRAGVHSSSPHRSVQV